MDVYNGKAIQLSAALKWWTHTQSPITITRPKAYWIDTLTYPTGWVECKAIAEKEGTSPHCRRQTPKRVPVRAHSKITHFVKDQASRDLRANPRLLGRCAKNPLGIAMSGHPEPRHTP